MRIIDADELIKDITNSADLGGELGKVVEVVKAYAKFMVATAPTIQIAQPERKRGEWLEHYAHEDGKRDEVWCSECREHYYFGGQLMNFCPNCGADMRNNPT